MPIRILVVDDHEICRLGLRLLCASRTEWQICEEASDAQEAIHKVLEFAPDIAILDVCLPGGMSGFDAAVQIRRLAPAVKIILFSFHDLPVTARLTGADAFVCKSSRAAVMVAAIERLSRPQLIARSASAT
ncbi:MAG TPA: response regulator transcription factor [Candidatus Acidoferrum sp.]|nr:response regulator transcription factor [Candidatus Acidoferrum sp.]